MPSPSVTLIDSEVRPTPPNHGEPHTTIKDYEWLLRRFTSPAWTIENCAFADHSRNILACTLNAKLRHDSGSLLRVSPKDRAPGLAGRPMKTVHRIYLTNTTSEAPCTVLTLPEDAPNSLNTITTEDSSSVLEWPQYENIDTHPHPNLHTVLNTASRSYIHSVENDLKYRPNIIRSLFHTVLTALGGTQIVSIEFQKQPKLTSFSRA